MREKENKMDLVTALRIKIEKEIEANESLLSQVLEAIGYVDNLLEDFKLMSQPWKTLKSC